MDLMHGTLGMEAPLCLGAEHWLELDMKTVFKHRKTAHQVPMVLMKQLITKNNWSLDSLETDKYKLKT